MGILLLAALAQASVFEDREAGLAVTVEAGWQLTFEGNDGRVVLRRRDEPTAFMRLDVQPGSNDEVRAGKWDAHLERFKGTMSAAIPGFAVQRHAASTKGEDHALEIWYSGGTGEEARDGFIRTVATRDRILVVSAALSRAKWTTLRETLEATARSAVFLKPEKGAGGVWTDPNNEFSIAVLAGHQVRPERNRAAIVSIFAPDGVTNLNIVIQGQERKMFALPAEDIRAILESNANAFQNFAFTQFEKITWEGRPAIKTSAEFNHGEIKISNLQFGVSTEKRSYYLTWSSRRETFQKDRPTFEVSLKTFKLKEKK